MKLRGGGGRVGLTVGEAGMALGASGAVAAAVGVGEEAGEAWEGETPQAAHDRARIRKAGCMGLNIMV